MAYVQTITGTWHEGQRNMLNCNYSGQRRSPRIARICDVLPENAKLCRKCFRHSSNKNGTETMTTIKRTKSTATQKSTTTGTTTQKVIHVATDKFARQFYPDALSPAKTLRARIRRNIDKFSGVLIATDKTKYAIRDTKEMREQFTKLLG